MTATQLGQRIQGLFDHLRDLLDPIDSRWMVLVGTFIVVLICRGLGLASLSNLVALFYIMYFVTLRATDRRE